MTDSHRKRKFAGPPPSDRRKTDQIPGRGTPKPSATARRPFVAVVQWTETRRYSLKISAVNVTERNKQVEDALRAVRERENEAKAGRSFLKPWGARVEELKVTNSVGVL